MPPPPRASVYSVLGPKKSRRAPVVLLLVGTSQIRWVSTGISLTNLGSEIGRPEGHRILTRSPPPATIGPFSPPLDPPSLPPITSPLYENFKTPILVSLPHLYPYRVCHLSLVSKQLAHVVHPVDVRTTRPWIFSRQRCGAFTSPPVRPGIGGHGYADLKAY